MKITKKDCSSCLACHNACPQKAILITQNKEGFYAPKIDKKLCTKCGLCQKICPANAQTKNNTPPQQTCAYAMKAIKDADRINNSSGGIFKLLAEEVISAGGIVFGAAFDENFKLKHCYAETIDALSKLFGSKYLQSNIGDSYKKAKEFLKQNRLVYFSGTPCQIAGLKAFLQKDYENLICQDLACHGAPSPAVFEKYLNEQKAVLGNIKHINFREKTPSWAQYSYKLTGDKKTLLQQHNANVYSQLFLSDLALNKSCFTCKYSGENRVADITLADFWGCNKLEPEMQDDLGVSLVLTHAEKGAKLLEKIGKKCTFKETDLQNAIKHNPCITTPVNKPNKRAEFFKMYKPLSFGEIADYFLVKNTPKTFKLKLKIKSLIKKK